MKLLLLAEIESGQLASGTRNALSCALQLSSDIDLLVAGYQVSAAAESAAQLSGVGRVLVCDSEPLQAQNAENTAALVVSLMADYQCLMAAAQTGGRNILPRVAALLDVEQITEIVEVVDQDNFVRPIYAGNALAHVQSLDPIKVIGVRPTAFPAAALSSDATPIVAVDAVDYPEHSQFVSEQQADSDQVSLADARIVVSGGRGLQNKENFALLQKLADQLGAALGASRAAVDAGFVGNDLQVGQTGKVVAPDLYMAFGISGAIQHMAGMKDSKKIVAINKDPEAPIFSAADYGLVSDLFPVLEELSAKLPAYKVRSA